MSLSSRMIAAFSLAASLVMALLSGQSAFAAVDETAFKPVAACESLLSVSLDGVGGAGSRVSKAEVAEKDGVAYCMIEGVLAPAITFQVELPVATWTKRFLQVGCGGLCGRVSTEVGAADGCTPVSNGGFVLAGTDMGHEGGNGEFGKDRQKRADFAYRGVHLTALASKALIEAFYGIAPSYSYFSGCSDGGREGLMEAQRYPEDFNGVIAGAAAMNFQVQNGLYHAWQAVSNTGPDGGAILIAPRLPILHKAVLDQCDAMDGLKDGLIANPTHCHPDLASITCPGDATDISKCLTSAEAASARKLYDGPRDARTGLRLTVGGPQPGSELAWAGVFVPEDKSQPIFSTMIALGSILNLNYQTNPPASFALKDMAFDLDTFHKLSALHPFYDATNPDLAPFEKAGGKLILWHGWADPHISPLNTIAYYQAVQKQMGGDVARQFARLYLFPGMHHCSGGEGPSMEDLLTPMMDWVEKGVAPEAIVASQPEATDIGGFGQPGSKIPGGKPMGASPAGAGMGKPPATPPKQQMGKIIRTRPVYAYPQQAEYVGAGDVNKAENFRPSSIPDYVDTPDWAGADFYKPYAPRM
jgi:hypothetical protein